MKQNLISNSDQNLIKLAHSVGIYQSLLGELQAGYVLVFSMRYKRFRMNAIMLLQTNFICALSRPDSGMVLIEYFENTLVRSTERLEDIVGYGTSSYTHHLTLGPEDANSAQGSIQLTCPN